MITFFEINSQNILVLLNLHFMLEIKVFCEVLPCSTQHFSGSPSLFLGYYFCLCCSCNYIAVLSAIT